LRIHLVLVAAVLTLYLASHVLPCHGGHLESHAGHSVSTQQVQPADGCDSGSVPHAPDRPRWVLAPRAAAEIGLLPLSAPPLPPLDGQTDGPWRPGDDHMFPPGSGRETLLAFCVARR